MLLRPLLLALQMGTIVSAFPELSVKTTETTLKTSRTLASNLMSYYQPSLNGLLPQPYYPWEAAGMWSTMLHYHHYTNDSQYNNLIKTALETQAGPEKNFMGSQTPGNDDQLWWGLTAMNAAELNFPGDWLPLAKNVFSEVIARWDNSTCAGGGLHWQISNSSEAYSYKNSITNGLAFQLAARLARSTQEKHYEHWAEKLFNWTMTIKYIDNSTYSVYDGAHTDQNCTDIDKGQWSYNVGVFLSGCAILYQHTQDSKWQQHVEKFFEALKRDFTSPEDFILREKCEEAGECNADQKSFKAYVVRWLAETKGLVPGVKGVLDKAVEGALGSCNGSPGKDACGVKWTEKKFDGDVGLGQQMGGLEVVLGSLAI